jgi:hypothetical protein
MAEIADSQFHFTLWFIRVSVQTECWSFNARILVTESLSRL